MSDVSETRAPRPEFRWACLPKIRLSIVLSVGFLAMGCAAAAKQDAKTAAPAAVEGAVEEASKPTTRDAVAEILEDPDIRSSSAELSEAVVQGAVRGAEKEISIAEMQRLTDAVVASVGASLAKSLERDIAPQMSLVVGRVIDDSFEHALNAQTEQRLQAVVAAVTRATAAGASEGLSQFTAIDSDPLSSPSATLTRNAWYSLGYNGAHGFEQAVRDAQLLQTENNQPSVLATLGTLAGWARMLPLVLVGAGVLIVMGLTAALVWALVALKRERRLMRDRTTADHQLAEAIRSGQGANWFDEFAKHVAHAAQHDNALGGKVR